MKSLQSTQNKVMNIKIIDNTPTSKEFELKVGQYFKDVEAEKVYQLAQVTINEYSLINVKTGESYSINYQLSDTMMGVFGGDFAEFVLIDNVTITIS